jgi:DnaJ-class molecular chaperone
MRKPTTVIQAAVAFVALLALVPSIGAVNGSVAVAADQEPTCSTCRGTKANPKPVVIPCDACSGKGKVKSPDVVEQQRIDCAKCGGSGKAYTLGGLMAGGNKTCTKCGGQGHTTKVKTVKKGSTANCGNCNGSGRKTIICGRYWHDLP